MRVSFGNCSLRSILVDATGSVSLSGAQADDRVRQIAGDLAARGIGRGDRVAILAVTSLDWVLVDLAVLALGAVVVPVYPTSSEHQLNHVVTDSGARLGVAADDTDRARLTTAGIEALTFAELAPDHDAVPMSVEDHLGAVRAHDTAMIVYTSGTTGDAKGCIITHGNMYAAAANTVDRAGAMFTENDAATALALPLSHVFGQTMLFASLLAATRTHLLPGVPDLVPALPGIAPTFLALVPYALEKIRKAHRLHLPAGEETAALLRGHDVIGERDHAVDQPTSSMLGGRLRSVICGGATLDATTVAFYAGFGVTICNCYGMTETATAASVNAPETNRVGTVGRPIPGTTIAVADDGEVLVSGPNVSPGYWGAAADRTAVDADGWLHTGDIGDIDPHGYLMITGRKKEILVTSGGKNVAPTPLEDRIRLHPLVSNAIVVGEGMPFVAALVTLDAAAYARWRSERGATGPGGDADLADPALRDAVAEAIADANSLVSRAESVREFRIVPGDLTVANGLLTSSLKLRRAAIVDHFDAHVSDMYGSVPSRVGAVAGG
ncbi:long-chain-fatty-acid--CoA ligase [Williamsia phyllosphaerae]|uniref:Long-chain-fatty-acid--CoA ligase n=1 Tax=Williamsia phyllosphaerae TaxID=885042 RepID=A0ABQ1V1R3_9NOCA|nr:long-chain-fatty-acid--CoA ligase [Williamsia phyllosphaerae]